MEKSEDLIKWNWILIARFASINQEKVFFSFLICSISISLPQMRIKYLHFKSLSFEAEMERIKTFLNFLVSHEYQSFYICYILV